jgi:hypothetical protein
LIYSVNSNSIRVDIGLSKEADISKASKRIEDLRAQVPTFFKKESIEVTEASFVSV